MKRRILLQAGLGGLAGAWALDSGAAAPAFDRAVLVQEFGMVGVGTMGLQYRPLLLFRDGSVRREPTVPPQDVDVQRSRAEEPDHWGRWQASGKLLQVQWPDGRTDKYDHWWPMRPAREGQTLSGRFNHTFGGGGFIDSDTLVFHPDGRFDAARAAGGHQGGTSVSSSRSAAGGHYRLAGHALDLAYPDGRTLRLFFGFFPDSDRAICLGPRSYSMD
jgi:hypothetical protein